MKDLLSHAESLEAQNRVTEEELKVANEQKAGLMEDVADHQREIEALKQKLAGRDRILAAQVVETYNQGRGRPSAIHHSATHRR